MEMYIWISLLIYIVGGVFSFGITFAYFQGEYACIAEDQYHSDRRFAMFWAFFPGCIIVAIFMSRGLKHGLKFK